VEQHLTWEKLVAYRAGQMTETEAKSVKSHLRQCVGCRELNEIAARLSHLEPIDTGRHRKRHESHLEPETLMMYKKARMSEAETLRIEEHLSKCPECLQMLAQLLKGERLVPTTDEKALLHSLPEPDPDRLATQLLEKAGITSEPAEAEVDLPTMRERMKGAFFAVGEMLTLRGQVARRIAFAIGVLAFAAVFLPYYASSRSDKAAEMGLARLRERYLIPREGFRPAGGFLPSSFSKSRDASRTEIDSKANKHFEQSLRWNSDNAQALHGKAMALYFAGDQSTAEKVLLQLLQNSPDDAVLLNDLGVVAASGGQLEAALHRFDMSLAIAPSFPEAWFNRALALQFLGREQEALKAWEHYKASQEGGDWGDIGEAMAEEIDESE